MAGQAKNAVDQDKKKSPHVVQAKKVCRWAVLTVGFASLIINLLLLTAPIYMLQVYDRVLTSRSMDTLLMLTVIALALICVYGALDYMRSLLLIRVGNRVDAVMSGPVFQASLRQAVRRAGPQRKDALDQLNTVRNFLSGPHLSSFFDVPWTPLYILVAALIHPLLGLIGLIAALLLVGLTLLIELMSRGPLKKAGQYQMEAGGRADRVMKAAELSKTMGLGMGLAQKWKADHKAGVAYQGQAAERASLVTSTTRLCRMAIQIVVLGAGAFLAVQHLISPGMMIAASIIINRALAPLDGMITAWRSFVRARTSWSSVTGLLESHAEPAQGLELEPPKGQIDLEEVFVVPPGSTKPSLLNVSFSLKPGEALGVVGPNGAGKSTLGRVLIGAWPTAKGAVRLDSAELEQWGEAALGSAIGYMPQTPMLFDGTVAENIARFTEDPGEKVIEAARLAGAHEMILKLPDGYDTVISGASGQLSAGMAQRVALARAVYGEPALVVLDEPNTGLDADGETALIDTIRSLKERGTTVVVIAHRPALIRGMTYVLVLNEGQVMRFAPPSEVLPAIVPVKDGAKTTVTPKVAGQTKPASA